jgi:hypothetical protein
VPNGAFFHSAGSGLFITPADFIYLLACIPRPPPPPCLNLARDVGVRRHTERDQISLHLGQGPARRPCTHPESSQPAGWCAHPVCITSCTLRKRIGPIPPPAGSGVSHLSPGSDRGTRRGSKRAGSQVCDTFNHKMSLYGNASTQRGQCSPSSGTVCRNRRFLDETRLSALHGKQRFRMQ